MTRTALRSVLLWTGMYIVAMLMWAAISVGPIHIPIRPGALTLLSTGFSVLARLTVLFMTGFTVGKRSMGNVGLYSMLAGAIAAMVILLFDLVWVVLLGGGPIILRVLSGSPLASLAYALVVFGMHVGIALLGGLTGRRFRPS